MTARLPCGILLSLLVFATRLPCAAEDTPRIEHFDTLYNSLTVEQRGAIVELRARSHRGEFLESAVDLSDPLRLVVPYTRSLFGAVFLQPAPQRVLVVGLGGAGFHRLFAHAFPETILETVELDPKVVELAEKRMGFQPNDHTPVTVMDGRLFLRRNQEKWDWIILDAFRGGFVPPHLKTQEYYQECAKHLSDRGVFISNLHATTQLYYADLKTIASVFPQVVLFHTANRGNVVACAVKYTSPAITDPSQWAAVGAFAERFGGRLDFDAIRQEQEPLPEKRMREARLLTDDFAPVEFLNVMQLNNTGEKQ